MLGELNQVCIFLLFYFALAQAVVCYAEKTRDFGVVCVYGNLVNCLDGLNRAEKTRYIFWCCVLYKLNICFETLNR